jgi:hypothetical protein
MAVDDFSNTYNDRVLKKQLQHYQLKFASSKRQEVTVILTASLLLVLKQTLFLSSLLQQKSEE